MKDTKFNVLATPAKLDEIHTALKGYWENDMWNITDPFFDEFRPEKWYLTSKTLDLSRLKAGVKEEIKYFYVYRISNKTLRLQTAVNYRAVLNYLTVFLNQIYPNITSLVDVAYEKFLMQWRSYLINQGISYNTHGRLSNPYYVSLVNQLYLFLQNFYDDREEFEKDIWDVRRIPGARFTDNRADYSLSFLDIPLPFRQFAKKYLKVRVGAVSNGQCRGDLLSLRLFFNFIDPCP